MAKKKKNIESKKLNPTPWIAGAVLVLGLAVLGGIYWNRTGKIEDIRFEGYQYINKQELQNQAEIPLGIHPDSLDTSGIIKKFEEINYVKQAELRMEPGGTMIVHITEREPLALLASGQRRAYVDAEGVRLPQVLGHTPDVPILYGFKTRPMTDTLQSDSFKTVSRFLQDLHQRPVSDATISEIAWNDKEGIVALTNENGVKLTFGTGDFDQRLRNWEAFYADVVRQKGIDQITSVDLRFKGQIVTREK